MKQLFGYKKYGSDICIDQHLYVNNVFQTKYYCIKVGDKSKLVVAGIYNPETNRKIRIVNEKGYKRLIALEGGIEGSVELVGGEAEKDKFYDEIGYSTATEANTTNNMLMVIQLSCYREVMSFQHMNYGMVDVIYQRILGCF